MTSRIEFSRSSSSSDGASMREVKKIGSGRICDFVRSMERWGVLGSASRARRGFGLGEETGEGGRGVWTAARRVGGVTGEGGGGG